MPRKREGTFWRAPDNTVLKLRITVVDNRGKKHRPWLPLDPSFDDDAAREIAAKVSKEAAGQPWDPSRFTRTRKVGAVATWDDYFDKLWSKSREGRVKSLRSDRYRWRLHLKPLLGSARIDETTSDTLRDVVQKLDAKAADPRFPRFNAKSAVNCWAIVSKMMDDAVHSKLKELRVLERNPCEGVKPPDAPDELERQWLFPAELRKLLECDAVPRWRRRLYAVAVYCYTRPGEVLALLWGSGLDVEHGMVRVNRAYDSAEGEFQEHTKTRDSRHFALEPVLRPLAEAMYREAGKRKGKLVFPTIGHLSETLRADLMIARVERAALHVQKPGARIIRFHDLRATGITYMAMRGDSDNDIRERAGHSDFKTTLKYIRRGHLAARDVMGDPFAPLPAGLLRESSRDSSPASSGNGGGSRFDAGSVEREKGFEFSAGHPGAASPAASSGETHAAIATGVAPGTVQDDSGTLPDALVIVNAARHRRLEMMAEAGVEGLGPGLAVCRALDAAYHADEPASVAALAEAAEALGLTAGKGGRRG